MRWGELSDKSKNILEWVCDLADEKYPLLNVKKNEVWSMESSKCKSSDIFVSESIFKEIRNYIYENKNEEYYLLKANNEELQFASIYYLKENERLTKSKKPINYLEDIEKFINHNLGLDFISKDMTITELLEYIDRIKNSYIPIVEQLEKYNPIS